MAGTRGTRTNQVIVSKVVYTQSRPPCRRRRCRCSHCRRAAIVIVAAVVVVAVDLKATDVPLGRRLSGDAPSPCARE